MSVSFNESNTPEQHPQDERKVLVFCPGLVRHGVWGDQGQRQGFRFGRYLKRERRWLVEGSPGNTVVAAWWELPEREPVTPRRPRGLNQIAREIAREGEPKAWIRKLVDGKGAGKAKGKS